MDIIMRMLGRKHRPETTVIEPTDPESKQALKQVAPKQQGRLDMVIAFDTTGSMATYIEAVRQEVADLVPRLFRDNEDLRLGIVAFGDYCDMTNAQEFGKAYQCLMPTDQENDIIRFIRESKNTNGGDGDEFYELVLRKIVEETPWREGATKVILLIADANPHPLGYSYDDRVKDNRIDWREEARKAAAQMIKVDTVTIGCAAWYRELSAMTNGVSVPFASSGKTARLVEAATMSRGSEKARFMFDEMMEKCVDEEMSEVYACYKKERWDS
ncbi:MAG: VWA domain-containing protein [Bacteroides sp.]|nr:VWA domain-containing protein [Bacteroides sp.]